MGTVCQIGLDIAKNYFQVQGLDKHGKEVFNKKLKRVDVLPFFANLPPCLIGLEACGGAHYWARELGRLDSGHRVRLLNPRQVKPFVINNKTDAADARAICEVVGRPSTRFVNIKSVEQQDLSAWHRIRERKVKERTALVNQIRALLSEQGIIIPQGINQLRKRMPEIIENLNNVLTSMARNYLSELYMELADCDATVAKYEIQIVSFAKNSEERRRIQEIPGVGPLTATAIVAHVGNAANFKNGREFAPYLGLTPKEHSSGGKQKLAGISKRGDSHIRRLLIQGARVIMRYRLHRAKAKKEIKESRIKWLLEVVERWGRHIAGSVDPRVQAGCGKFFLHELFCHVRVTLPLLHHVF